MMSGWLRNGLSVVLGVGAAVATTLVMNSFAVRTNTDGERSTRSIATAPADVQEPPSSGARHRRTPSPSRPETGRNFQSEPAEVLPAEAPEQQEGNTDEAEPQEMSREAVAARMHAKYEGYASLHRNDPVDPGWAPQAEAHLTRALEAWGRETDASIAEAECKTEVCRAKLEWKDYATAERQGLELASLEIPGLNCTQRIWLEEPEDAAQKYSAYLYLDCAQLRLGMLDAEP